MKNDVTLLAYAGCSTCRKARAWLDARGIAYAVRPIVEAPPTEAELRAWIAASGAPVRKWLNVSGQSYRALRAREDVDAASEADLVRWLAQDGKLVKRPVLVRHVGGKRVVVGFREEAYEAVFGGEV